MVKTYGETHQIIDSFWILETISILWIGHKSSCSILEPQIYLLLRNSSSRVTQLHGISVYQTVSCGKIADEIMVRTIFIPISISVRIDLSQCLELLLDQIS